MGGSMVMVDKAESFRSDAETAGWSTKVTRVGARVTVTALRGDDESVSVTWEGNACLNESLYKIDGKTKKMRNAAAARRILASSGNPTPVVRTSEKTTKKQTTIPQPRVEVEMPEPRPKPTWGARHISKPDREILRLVIGKEITWINSRTKQPETAKVLSSPNQRQLRIERTASQKRVITFAALGEGFRSLYLEAIVGVR